MANSLHAYIHHPFKRGGALPTRQAATQSKSSATHFWVASHQLRNAGGSPPHPAAVPGLLRPSFPHLAPDPSFLWEKGRFSDGETRRRRAVTRCCRAPFQFLAPRWNNTRGAAAAAAAAAAALT